MKPQRGPGFEFPSTCIDTVLKTSQFPLEYVADLLPDFCQIFQAKLLRVRGAERDQALRLRFKACGLQFKTSAVELAQMDLLHLNWFSETQEYLYAKALNAHGPTRLIQLKAKFPKHHTSKDSPSLNSLQRQGFQQNHARS